MTNGLYDHLIGFLDLKEVGERYDVSWLLQGKEEGELMRFVTQALIDLRTLTSWSTLLKKDINIDALRDHAMLATLMSAYAREELGLKDQSPLQMIRSKGLGFAMARQCMKAPQSFDLEDWLKKAQPKDALFLKEQENVLKNHHFSDEFMQKSDVKERSKENAKAMVLQHAHLCEAAFGEPLPPPLKAHMEEKVWTLLQQSPKESSSQSLHVLSHTLMNQEVFHQAHAKTRQRNLETHEDLFKLFQEHTHLHQSYQLTQKFILQEYQEQELQKRKSRGMSL